MTWSAFYGSLIKIFPIQMKYWHFRWVWPFEMFQILFQWNFTKIQKSSPETGLPSLFYIHILSVSLWNERYHPIGSRNGWLACFPCMRGWEFGSERTLVNKVYNSITECVAFLAPHCIDRIGASGQLRETFLYRTYIGPLTESANFSLVTLQLLTCMP